MSDRETIVEMKGGCGCVVIVALLCWLAIYGLYELLT